MKIIAILSTLTKTTMEYVIIVARRTARIMVSAVKIMLSSASIKKIILINIKIKTAIQYETKIEIAFSEAQKKKIKKVTEIVSMIGFGTVKTNSKG
ncbi:MAG: hypothetical protein PHQ09_05340 [Actinomycetota bacterium]|nr:hypothetical protein [Actinomycetota bacterium]